MRRLITLASIILVIASCSRRANDTGSEEATKKELNMKVGKVTFLQVIEDNLKQRGIEFDFFCNFDDELEGRVLREYGALFIASDRVKIPEKCIFNDENEVSKFQNSVSKMSQEIVGVNIELQVEAMLAYLAAREEAIKQGVDITPRGGEEAARRNFADTLRLWNSRFEPACQYWKEKGMLTDEQINHLKSLPIREQVKQVLNLEKKGIFFSTRFDGTILRSVAAPGASQHLSMLALDINEYKDERVRQIMNRHGWFRTVLSDEPHFTFLGRSEEELTSLGLKKVEPDFWIPDLP
ncbi:MAG: hypothetical protein N2Z23_00580 [Pyrinomonadaceae bacterium]|nr:hypothetical protein [Pyrinomonadaceae bacterium]MCX7638929.1 hypothetical protein [Pyrinomonadaceae bacterium]MDW8304934.1 hypothetical protein [Acidobacteriota bacterium]